MELRTFDQAITERDLVRGSRTKSRVQVRPEVELKTLSRTMESPQKELRRPRVLKPRESAELQSAPDRLDLRSDPSSNVIKRRRGTRPSDRLPLSHETCFKPDGYSVDSAGDLVITLDEANRFRLRAAFEDLG